MAFEHNPGNFSMFRNKNPKSEKSPYYTGSGKVVCPDGAEMEVEIAGWIKEGPKGKFISGTVKEDTYQKANGHAAQPAYEPGADEEDMPF
jgi:hypothetical protein